MAESEPEKVIAETTAVSEAEDAVKASDTANETVAREGALEISEDLKVGLNGDVVAPTASSNAIENGENGPGED